MKDIQLNWVRHVEGECSIQPTNPARLFPVGFSENVEDAYVEDCGNAGEEVLGALEFGNGLGFSSTCRVPQQVGRNWPFNPSLTTWLHCPIRRPTKRCCFRLSDFGETASNLLTRNNGCH